MPDKLIGKDPNQLTLVIENREIILESAKLLKTMDTCADAFTGVMPWEPGLDPEIDDITGLGKFNEAKIYIGNELQMIGILYNIRQRSGLDGIVKEFEIYTKTADMIDSSVRWPFEENNIKLDQRCKNQAEKFGIDVIIDAGVDVGGRFSRVTAEQTDLCFNHLSGLAMQRGLLISNTKEGELLIIKPNINGYPIGTLEEENQLTENFEIYYNGRERFNKYVAIVSSSQKTRTRVKQRTTDLSIPATRFLSFNADESLPGEGLNAAVWRRNKSAANAVLSQFPVNSWYGPDGSLWNINKTITIKSPVMNIKKGYTFLINQVEFNYRIDGTTAILDLKPPSMYTIGDLEEPWLD